MIKDFLIINCTGKKNKIAFRSDNKYFIERFQNNIKSNTYLVSNILKFLAKKNVKMNEKVPVLVNLGPGSFSSIRIAVAVAKGIKIVFDSELYGYKGSSLTDFTPKNIEKLIKKKLFDRKIKPIYLD